MDAASVRQCLLAVVLSVSATCRQTKEGASVPAPELRRIASFGDLVGYWQFAGPSGRHVAALDRDETRDEDQLQIFTLRDDGWRLVRGVPLVEPSARALDGARLGDTTFFCVEVNRSHPLHLWAADYTPLVHHDSTSAVSLTARLDLAPADVAATEVRTPWHVMDLQPEAWLFRPRLVRGDVRTPWIIASMADGRVALLDTAGEGRVLRALPIRQALEPQATRLGNELVVAFQRPAATDVSPFWLEPRNGKIVSGDLVVAHGTQPELNLSAVLGFGPVVRFALAPGWQGGVWLFALIDAPVGTDVVALERAQGKWIQRERRSFDREFSDVSAEAGANPGEWHLVYQTASAEGSTLEYQAWQRGR